jgi:DNA end-binding protein Ku
MHSIWKGAISFGLVAIPIQLFAATEERGVSLHQVHAKDGGRIRYRRFCAVDGDEVPYGDIAKGYELPNGDVVVLAEEDFAQLPLSSSRAIDVLSFVEASTIDPIQLSRCYYCDPTSPDVKPYVLLRDALERTGKVAVVKVALRQRESLAILRPRDRMLVLQLLLWPDEVREPRFALLDDDVLLRPQELRMAESYVETLTGEIDRQETVDQYRVALEQLVEAKAAGREIERPPPAESAGTAVDLMDALRRSVEEAKRSRGEGARAAKSPAKRAAAGSATPKQASAKRTGLARQAAAKKTGARKAVAREGVAREAVAKQTAKKTTAKKATAKKATSRSGSPASPR